MDRVGFEPTASRKLQMQSVRANHCATCPLHKAMVSGIKKPSVQSEAGTVPDRSVVQSHSFVQTSCLGGVQNGFASIFFSGLSIYHTTLW